MKVIYSNLEKIDFKSTISEVELLNVLDVQALDKDKDKTVIVSADNKKIDQLPGTPTVYIPYESLPENYRGKDNVHVYFDLELYPFFEKVKEVFLSKNKGVFRFRRHVGQHQTESIIIEDMFVMTSLLGKPEDVEVIHSKKEVNPQHTIVTILFKQGTMAHMEYTFSGQERLELEWSGMKRIIEFDSEEMTPITPKHHTSLPLTYSVDAILFGSHQLDAALAAQLEFLKELINGGAEA